MSKLPTFHGAKFQWKKGKGYAKLSDLRLDAFPVKGFYIRSHKTGRSHLFLPNGQSMEANEFYDGERYDFFVPGGNIEVHILAN